METGPTAHTAPVVLTMADGIAIITLNRPEIRNALNAAMVSRLQALLVEVETDETIRAVVIRGTGGAFMAGGDIGQFKDMLESDAKAEANGVDGFSDLLDHVNAIVLTLRRMQKPALAVVDGAAAGFGVSLALACDMILASETATFTPAYSRIGATPDGGISRHLPLAIGRQAAFELLMVGEQIDAHAARKLGLVNRVVPPDAVDAETQALARRLADLPTVAIGRTKALLNAATDGPLEDRLDAEAKAFVASSRTADFKEGVRAFLEKRKPAFTGR